MMIFKRINALRQILKQDRFEKKSIGFVPTMGALHAGHLALAHHSISSCAKTVFMIFVNPKQFCANEDFDVYPRNLVRDIDLLEREGVDYCFAPSLDEMWPEGNETFVDTEYLSSILLGKQRTGHFRGVTTILAKAFNVVQPDKAFFGEKDFQQLVIVRRMVKDLSFPIEIVGVPTWRHSDGLAASSRNLLLSDEDRKAAVIISQAWKEADRYYNDGERCSVVLKRMTRDFLNREKRGTVEAIDLLDPSTLDVIEGSIKKTAVLLLAVRFGGVILIDQHILGTIVHREGVYL
ncbi:MAG: pantoate--beta-alanine ligase [Candidatus Tokpelaia sp. JSC161]|jgi:pantoate--beta-alanine ligase|nr:MAG: pantoate--beta-alanine ligase [Candidatus Tokpelaia sp. JSC161]